MSHPSEHTALSDLSAEKTWPNTVLVMGGSGVIGGAICLRFAEANWKIGVHYHCHEQSARGSLFTF